MFKTIGTDIELFAIDVNGLHKSLCGLIGGTKESPAQVPTLAKGFALQEDNVAVEYNIPPSTSKTTFLRSNKTIIKEVRRKLKELGFEVANDSSAFFTKGELIHPNALIFGCEPDYNAWTQVENESPICDEPSLRTAGGHIHVGTDGSIIDIAKNMDLLLGVPSVLLDDSEGSVIRRKLYGKAGAIRPKPYGFEYRTLSNFWIFKDSLIKWVFEQTKRACNEQFVISKELQNDIINCINNGDKDAAQRIIKANGLNLPV